MVVHRSCILHFSLPFLHSDSSHVLCIIPTYLPIFSYRRAGSVRYALPRAEALGTFLACAFHILYVVEQLIVTSRLYPRSAPWETLPPRTPTPAMPPATSFSTAFLPCYTLRPYPFSMIVNMVAPLPLITHSPFFNHPHS